MTVEKAIEVLKSECYVFNPLNLDRTTLINTALDTAIEALEKKGESVTEFADRCRECGAECGRALKHKDEVIDKLLQYLVEYEIDIPCDYLNGTNYCCENCKYNNPVKECWIKWAEEKVREESEE